jgi:hypothetical protein
MFVELKQKGSVFFLLLFCTLSGYLKIETLTLRHSIFHEMNSYLLI